MEYGHEIRSMFVHCHLWKMVFCWGSVCLALGVCLPTYLYSGEEGGRRLRGHPAPSRRTRPRTPLPNTPFFGMSPGDDTPIMPAAC